MRKHTTIVIITYNHTDIVIEATKKCFETVLRTVNLYAPHSYEVMFIDNNSCEKWKEWLKNLQVGSTHIKVIFNQENVGFAKAANQGMIEASKFSDYVVLLNNDTIPRNGWLYPMIQAAESDPKIAMVGAKILRPGTDLVIHSGTLLENGEVIDPYSALTPNNLVPRKLIEERLWVNGACMMIKSSVIKEFGVFDDKTFGLYFEEADYMIRLHQAGYRVVYCPAAEIEHWEKLTCKDVPGTKEQFYGNWRKLVDKYAGYFHWQRNLDGPPKVAIVMPCYNSEKYMKNTIDCVLNQSYANWKLFAIDDGSTDGTRDILFNYEAIEKQKQSLINPSKAKSDRFFIIVRSENGGVALARNAALNTIEFNNNAERFKYVFFLDSDDLWDPKYLERMVIFLEQCPEVDMSYSLCDSKFEDGKIAIPYGIPENITTFDRDLMLNQNYLHISFIAVRWNTIQKVGKFYPGRELNGIEDWDYESRVALSGANIQCYPEVLGTYIVRQSGNAKEGSEEKLALLRKRQATYWEELK